MLGTERRSKVVRVMGDVLDNFLDWMTHLFTLGNYQTKKKHPVIFALCLKITHRSTQFN